MRVGKFRADLHLCMVSSTPQSIPKRQSLSEPRKVQLREFRSLPRVITACSCGSDLGHLVLSPVFFFFLSFFNRFCRSRILCFSYLACTAYEPVNIFRPKADMMRYFEATFWQITHNIRETQHSAPPRTNSDHSTGYGYRHVMGVKEATHPI